MNNKLSILLKLLTLFSIAIIGITILIFGLVTKFHLAIIFGILIILMFLMRFPALIIAIGINGAFLYFLALEYIGLSPESNITGAYYLGMRLLALSALFIYLHMKRISPKIIDINMFLVILFSSYIFVQYALFSQTAGASKKIVFFIVQGILMFFVGRLITKELLNKALKYSLVLSCLLSIYSLIKIVANINNVGVFFTGGLWNYHGQVYFLMTGAIVAICLYVFRVKTKISIWWHILFWSYLILTFIESIIAASKGGILGFTVIIVILAVYISKRFVSNFSFRLHHILIAVLLILTCTVSWQVLGDNLYIGMLRLSQALEILDLASGGISDKQYANSIQSRLDEIVSQYRRFYDRPLLGFGFGNSSDFYSYVHNMFLEVLFETGIIGLILFIAIISSAFKKIFHLWIKSKTSFTTQDADSIAIIMLWLYFMITGLFSRSIFDNYQFWFCTGVIMNPANNEYSLKLVSTNKKQIVSY